VIPIFLVPVTHDLYKHTDSIIITIFIIVIIFFYPRVVKVIIILIISVIIFIIIFILSLANAPRDLNEKKRMCRSG